jgi:holliday junction DNA helicase RuvB
LEQRLETSDALRPLDSLGLDAAEQAYLRILADGPARLNVIATRIGMPIQTVQRVTEATLVRLDLVGKDKGGLRELTAKARKHLSGLRSETD